MSECRSRIQKPGLQGCSSEEKHLGSVLFFPEVADVTVRRSRRRQDSSVDLTLKNRGAIFLLAICHAHSRNRSLARGVVGACDVLAVWQVNSERGRKEGKKNELGRWTPRCQEGWRAKGRRGLAGGGGGRATEAKGPWRVKPPAIKNKSTVCFSYGALMTLSY